MHKFTHQQIVDRQKQRIKEPRIPLTVVLDNIRSLNNVGAIFRTADGVGVEKLWLCGITGFPPQKGLLKTALGAEDHVSWEYSKDVVSVVKDLKAQGYTIVALEQMEGSVEVQNYVPQGKMCLIVGNEIDGINPALIELCDEAIEIHMSGIKNSLNVGTAFGIVAYFLKTPLQNC